MLLLLQHNKPFPDSMLKYFGSMDEYRYELYSDLKRLKKQERFPALYNNHLDLGRSRLLDEKSYSKPDTVVYVDRLSAEYKNKKGFLYFYKYKTKKDDLVWKLAVVGLAPGDPKQFEFEDSNKLGSREYSYTLFSPTGYNQYDFTEFTDTKIEEDEPMLKQLDKALKKILYSRRKSAMKFYDDNGDRSDVLNYDD
jgi:hypothetical protein